MCLLGRREAAVRVACPGLSLALVREQEGKGDLVARLDGRATKVRVPRPGVVEIAGPRSHHGQRHARTPFDCHGRRRAFRIDRPLDCVVLGAVAGQEPGDCEGREHLGEHLGTARSIQQRKG
jgi:hypothetical protein